VARARALFFEGVAAEDAKDFARAAARYEEARRIVASPQILFNLASCQERLGRLVEARRLFEEARDAAEGAGGRGGAEVAAEARQRRDGLDARMPRIVVRLRESAAGATVLLDGQAIDPAASPHRVDPGAHRIVARADGTLGSFDLSFDAQVGTERVVDVDLVLSPPAAAPLASSSSSSSSLAARSAASRAAAGPTAPVLVLAGVAIAAGIGAVATGVVGYGDRDRYLELNGAPTPDNRGERESLRESGTALYTASAVLSVTAVVSAAVGVYLHLRQRAQAPSVASAVPAGPWPPSSRACAAGPLAPRPVAGIEVR